ncbi:MAG: hypothetical protein ACYS14_14470, partial [Planctomycetota bacterium]
MRNHAVCVGAFCSKELIETAGIRANPNPCRINLLYPNRRIHFVLRSRLMALGAGRVATPR